MKRAKVGSVESASRGYRCGMINASKKAGTTAQLDEFNEYTKHYNWTAHTMGMNYEIVTDRKGAIVKCERECTPFRVELRHWVDGQGFDYSETFDHIDDLITAEEYINCVEWDALKDGEDIMVEIWDDERLLSEEWLSECI